MVARKSSAKKPPSPKTSAKAAPSASPTLQDLTAERDALRAQVQAQRAADEAEDADDDEDDDEDGDGALAKYDPSTHGIYNHDTHTAVPNDVLAALTQGERQLKELIAATSAANAKNQENLFTGFATNSQLASQQLQSAYDYGNQQRARGDALQEEIAKRDRHIAEMIKQSEDAKLQRETLAAEVERGRQSLERLQKELDAKHRMRMGELAAVQNATAPLMAAAGKGLEGLIAEYAPKALPGGGGGAAPTQQQAPQAAQAPGTAAPNADAAPQQQVEEAVVSLEGAAEWKEFVVELLNESKAPEVAAYLRAMLCSYALDSMGAPPLPSSVNKDVLFDVLVKDIGQQRAVLLLQSCKGAYVAV